MTRWLTIGEVVGVTQLSEDAIYRALRAGRLRGSKCGGSWRVMPADLEAWFAAGCPGSQRPVRVDEPVRARRRGGTVARLRAIEEEAA